MNEIKVDPIITQQDLNRFVEFEGMVSHFYLDGKSLVTIGIGCVIANKEAATMLNMYFKSSNMKAKLMDIIGEWNTVKSLIPGKLTSYYAENTRLYLPDSDIINLFTFRIHDKIFNLRKSLPEYDKFPKDVQDVLIDMSFNLGISGLIMKFPKFIELLRKRNYSGAANECHREGISEARNNWAYNTLINIET